MFVGVGWIAVAVVVVAVIALVVDRRLDGPESAARALLDERLAAGHVTVEEHAERIAVLDHRRRRPARWPWAVGGAGVALLLVAVLLGTGNGWTGMWSTHRAAMAAAWDGSDGGWAAHQQMMADRMGFAGRRADPDEESQPAIEGARSITVVASDMRFDPTQITADAGADVNLTLRNDDEIVHDLTIPALGVRVTAQPGETATVGVPLDEAGTYAFFCSIPGHEQAGMRGTLVVR